MMTQRGTQFTIHFQPDSQLLLQEHLKYHVYHGEIYAHTGGHLPLLLSFVI